METELPTWVNIVIVILGLLGGVVTWGIKTLTSKIAKKMDLDEAKTEALEAIGAGVAGIYEEGVRQAKAAAADGRLTEKEKSQFKSMAIERAKNIATGAGKDLLLGWGKDKLGGYVEKFVTKAKQK